MNGVTKRGWIERNFATANPIDGRRFDSPTHSVDCFKGRVALELRAIDVGVIVTRGSKLQKIFNRLGKGGSYGRPTRHHEKLIPHLDGGGGGGGCLGLAFAILERLYFDDVTPPPGGVPSPS